MNKLILCEGKTDAILLSYYLGCVQQWIPCMRGPKNFRISVDEKSGESAYWYQRGEDRLLICGVGGKDKFGGFFADFLRIFGTSPQCRRKIKKLIPKIFDTSIKLYAREKMCPPSPQPFDTPSQNAL